MAFLTEISKSSMLGTMYYKQDIFVKSFSIKDIIFCPSKQKDSNNKKKRDNSYSKLVRIRQAQRYLLGHNLLEKSLNIKDTKDKKIKTLALQH